MDARTFLAFCETFRGNAGWVFDFAWWFLLGAIVFAAVAALVSAAEKVVMLLKVKEATHEQMRSMIGDPDTGIIQALGSFVEALTKAPTWLGMLGAGCLLFWLGGSSYGDLCKPIPSKSVTTKTSTTVITKTVPKTR
jgi:hypothetical protein